MRQSIAKARRAFTLVELLVVIVIITVVISLVIPAVGKVRRSARVAQSQQLASNVANAASTFKMDKGRLPGFYSAHDMGTKENADIGMPAMLNALMELSGGVVAVGGPIPAGSNAVQVAPFAVSGGNASRAAWFDPKLLGTANASGGGYFTPDKKYITSPRPNLGADIARFGKLPTSIPDLVDPFGTPVLAWSADEAMNSPVAFDSGNSGANNFVRTFSDTRPAMFYWNSNAAHLKTTSLGKLRTSQKKQGASKEFSLIGEGATDFDDSLTGVLGNPGFHTGDLASGVDAILPSQPRGRFVVHAADPDGFYFGNKSSGKAQAGVDSLKFGYNFLLSDGTVRKDEKNQVTSTDVTKGFEDILAVGGS